MTDHVEVDLGAGGADPLCVLSSDTMLIGFICASTSDYAWPQSAWDCPF